MLTKWSTTFPSMVNELSRLSREMDRLFRDTWPYRTVGAGLFPPVNLYDEGDAFVVRAEVPGIDPGDIDVQATHNTVQIKGERRAPAVSEEVSFHRRERDYGVFSRTLALPQEVDPDKVSATCKNGILEVRLPKAEAAKPRKIRVAS